MHEASFLEYRSKDARQSFHDGIETIRARLPSQRSGRRQESPILQNNRVYTQVVLVSAQAQIRFNMFWYEAVIQQQQRLILLRHIYIYINIRRMGHMNDIDFGSLSSQGGAAIITKPN